MRLFVSYTRRDGLVTSGLLLKLRSHLGKTFKTFIHLLEQENLKHQQLGVIIAILRCHLILVIESPGTYESRWVKFEITLGRLLLRPIIRIPIDALAHWQDHQANASNTTA